MALPISTPVSDLAPTLERLRRLYAQHEHELTGPAPVPADLAVPAAPAVAHCR